MVTKESTNADNNTSKSPLKNYRENVNNNTNVFVVTPEKGNDKENSESEHNYKNDEASKSLKNTCRHNRNRVKIVQLLQPLQTYQIVKNN